jgi:hypothetical protein
MLDVRYPRVVCKCIVVKQLHFCCILISIVIPFICIAVGQVLDFHNRVSHVHRGGVYLVPE